MDLLRQAVTFGLVGLVNTAVGLTVIYVMMFGVGASPVVANMVGYGVGLCVSFTLNSRITFRQGLTVLSGLRFIAAFAISYFANLVCLVTLIGPGGISPTYAQLGSMVIYTLVFFLLSRFFVFNDNGKAEADR